MEYDYSFAMKNLLKKPGRPVLKTILIILICLFAVSGIYTYQSAKSLVESKKENILTFDTHIPTVTSAISSQKNPNNSIPYSFSSLSPKFLSEPFASSEESGNTIYYCIAIDENNKPCVVAIDADFTDQYQELRNYTYSDSTVLPATVTMKGMPEKMDNNFGELAIKALNAFYSKKVGFEANYSAVLGTLYLNTTKVPEIPASNAQIEFIYIMIIISLVIIYGITIIPEHSKKRRQNNTLAKYNCITLLHIDNELSQSTTAYYEMQNLYITENYLISKISGLDIIPLNTIIHIFGYLPTAKKNKQMIIAVTQDGEKHEIATFPSQQMDTTISNIIERIKQVLPNIKYGFESNFYTKSYSDVTPEQNNLYGFDTENKSHILPGIIGAIIGSFFGCIIWIVIGKLGFIAGFAGFVMVLLSMHGYRTLAGFMDKKGQIIAICIAMIMIFVANYTACALDIFKCNNITDLMNAYKQLPRVFSITNIGGIFVKNLIIGYLLSIMSCYKLIIVAFTNAEKERIY